LSASSVGASGPGLDGCSSKLFKVGSGKITISRVIFCGFVSSVYVFDDRTKFTGKLTSMLGL
jgi:hypothetical protein